MSEKNLEINEDLEIVEEKDEPTFNQEKLEELLDFDFSSDKDFNLEENYKEVLAFDEKEEREKISQEEKIIASIGPSYVEEEFFNKVNSLRKNLYSYFKRYEAKSEYVAELLKDPVKNDEELTKLFAIAQFMLKTYKETIKNLFFMLKITKTEYQMIIDVMKNKSEVTGNETLLDGMDSLLAYLKEWEKIYKESNGVDVMTLPMDIKSIVLLYHFLSKKSVKGFSGAFYTLRTIMYKLKETNDIFSAYNTLGERLAQDFTIWGGSITPMSTPSKEDSDEEVKSE
jgi:hypothetical protein